MFGLSNFWDKSHRHFWEFISNPLLKHVITSTNHCVKRVRIWNYSGLHFPAFRLNNSKYGHLLRTLNRNFFLPKDAPPWRCSVKKSVPKNFVDFTRKNLQWSLFLIKLQAQRCVTVFKKRLYHRFFPVKFAKFVRTPVLKNTCKRRRLKTLSRTL